MNNDETSAPTSVRPLRVFARETPISRAASRYGMVCIVGAANLLVVPQALALPDAAETITATGPLRGATDAGIVSFKGIPYAAAPIGALRWRPPQPLQPWHEVRDATQFGADCLQEPAPGDAAPTRGPLSENCLFLNVWRPQDPGKKRLPVMVWLYGGGYVNGGTTPRIYDGAALARQGVMMVTVNYRLGRFGFFAHPALTREAQDTAANPSVSAPALDLAAHGVGNYALMDQIAALRWVRANAAAFGGDPQNVTVFGESAGGSTVMTLLTSPAAAGLFDKAIVESGGGRAQAPLRPLSGNSETVASAESIGLAFAAEKGIVGDGGDALAALRALPADAVVSGLNMGTPERDTFVGGPFLDGRVVLGPRLERARAGDVDPSVSVVIGANDADIGAYYADDKAALFSYFGKSAETARLAYDPTGAEPFEVVANAFAGDRVMVEPARAFARALTQHRVRVFEYRFSYVLQAARQHAPGAQHACELPYVFGTLNARYGSRNVTPQDRDASRAIMAYWTAFAKSKPESTEPFTAAGPRLPLWPAYSAREDRLLDFTNAGPIVQSDPRRARLDLLERRADIPPTSSP